VEASLLLWIDQRKIAGVAVHLKQSNIVAKADNVLKVAYLLLIDKIKIAENQTINSYLWCPEQKQPNERVCTVMEVGSSFGEIDNILIYRLLKINRCKNRCHLFPRKIAKFHFGGQSGDKNIRLNLVVKLFICNFVYRPSQC
jgi:hypothetical protein